MNLEFTDRPKKSRSVLPYPNFWLGPDHLGGSGGLAVMAGACGCHNPASSASSGDIAMGQGGGAGRLLLLLL